MNEDSISAALESLPRDAAGPSFTAGVLRRLDREARQPPPARWTLMAATAAVLLTAGGLGWQEWQQHKSQRQARIQLESMLAEQQALRAELRSLLQLAEEARPIVYLGGNEKVDLVLDLARLKSQGGLRLGGAATAEARPAAAPPGERNLQHNVIY